MNTKLKITLMTIGLLFLGACSITSNKTINSIGVAEPTKSNRNPASETEIISKEEIYLVLAQVFRSIDSGVGRQSCVDQDLKALQFMGVYISKLRVLDFNDDVLIYPEFSAKEKPTTLGRGMCFKGPKSSWGNMLK